MEIYINWDNYSEYSSTVGSGDTNAAISGAQRCLEYSGVFVQFQQDSMWVNSIVFRGNFSKFKQVLAF